MLKTCNNCHYKDHEGSEEPCVTCATANNGQASNWLASGAIIPLAPIPDTPVINPKELAGAKKPAVWNVVPRWVSLLVGRVMSVGAAKYGRFNYRDSNVSAMTYVDAIERHLQLWQDGEELDEETGVSHLASVMAGCTILLDAQANGRMGDDRPKTGLVRKTLDELQGLLTSLPLPKPQY